MRLPKFLPPLLLAAAAACTNVPELEEGITPDLRRADYPDLVPLDSLMQPLPAPQEQSAETQAALDARAARLRARAAALKTQTN
jgi:hypothetical protein